MAVPWEGWRKWLRCDEAGGHGHALVRLEETAVSCQGWRKWPCHGEAGGNGHDLARLERRALPSQGWRTPRCHGEAEKMVMGMLEEWTIPAPCRYLSKADLRLQVKTLPFGFATVAGHVPWPSA